MDVSAVFRVNFDATGWIVVGIDDGSGGTWLVWSLPALSDITQTFPDGTTTASLAQSNDPSTFSNGQALPAVVSATPRELLAQVQSPNASGPGIVDFYVTVTQPAGE